MLVPLCLRSSQVPRWHLKLQTLHPLSSVQEGRKGKMQRRPKAVLIGFLRMILSRPHETSTHIPLIRIQSCGPSSYLGVWKYSLQFGWPRTQLKILLLWKKGKMDIGGMIKRSLFYTHTSLYEWQMDQHFYVCLLLSFVQHGMSFPHSCISPISLIPLLSTEFFSHC